MADVALLARVSHQTVSRVLNDSPGIRPATRERVLTAIEELGYRRNIAARILASKRSGSIGVITSGAGHYGPTSIALGLETSARAAGYRFSATTLADISESSLRAAADRLLEQSVEALVVIVAHRVVLPFAQSFDVGIPVVLVEGDLSATPLTAGVDQVQGARLATRHLIDLGHETVFHLAGPTDWIEATVRREAWRDELEAARRRVPAPNWGGDWSAQSGYETGRALAREPGVTAVFAANDQMALGLIRALNEAGLRVPEDVSVVGFDDLPESPFFRPPLTTIRQDFAELGRRAMELIKRLLDGDPHAAVPLVEATLVVRQSTAPPRP